MRAASKLGRESRLGAAGDIRARSSTAFRRPQIIFGRTDQEIDELGRVIAMQELAHGLEGHELTVF